MPLQDQGCRKGPVSQHSTRWRPGDLDAVPSKRSQHAPTAASGRVHQRAVFIKRNRRDFGGDLVFVGGGRGAVCGVVW